MEFLYLDLFSQSRRPDLHISRPDSFLRANQLICDSLFILFRNWDSKGAGDFIPEPLGVDMIRAAAYKRAGISMPFQNDGKVRILQVSRVNKRRILNEQELFTGLKMRLGSETRKYGTGQNKTEIQFAVLEKQDAKDQVIQFSQLDVLVAAHGAGLTNIIFMLPKSYLVELMPPYWDLACYRRLAEDAGIGYKMYRAVGKKGPQCDKDPYSTSCRQKGIRDRDFNVSIENVVELVSIGVRYVQKKKYSVI
jgi:hypothetical protein